MQYFVSTSQSRFLGAVMIGPFHSPLFRPTFILGLIGIFTLKWLETSSLHEVFFAYLTIFRTQSSALLCLSGSFISSITFWWMSLFLTLVVWTHTLRKYQCKKVLILSVPKLVGIPCHMFCPVLTNRDMMISASPSPIALMNVFTLPSGLFVLVRALPL